jgi:hypothetical protein
MRRVTQRIVEVPRPRTGRRGELLAVIERHGDRALTLVWRNKGTLTVTTVLETFLADP